RNVRNSFLSFTKCILVFPSVAQLSQPKGACIPSFWHSGIKIGSSSDTTFHVALDFKSPCSSQLSCSLPNKVLFIV
ncbi:MAG TPA: hypothetical protein VN704_05255, partial [Verrucomicrobiae bacterium]|nr:hypothetical protein [Verrucomicrobiae bacterium]